MPKDSQNRFHNSTQRAMRADKMAGVGAAPKPSPLGGGLKEPEAPGGMGEGGENTHSIVAHGDCTFHSESQDGERVEHPTAGHAAVHFLSRHGEDGKHMAVHSDGFSHTTHQAETGGEAEGPHDHENLEELKSAMDQFLTEEEGEPAAPIGIGEAEEY